MTARQISEIQEIAQVITQHHASIGVAFLHTKTNEEQCRFSFSQEVYATPVNELLDPEIQVSQVSLVTEYGPDFNDKVNVMWWS